MNYWMTTHWPPARDKPVKPHRHIFLEDDKLAAADGLSVGDVVFIFELKSGESVVRSDGTRVARRVGRRGIVSRAIVESVPEDQRVAPERYANGTSRWWRWKAETRQSDEITSRFVPHQRVNEILGYKKDNPLRAPGKLRSGLLRLTTEQGERLQAALMNFENSAPREAVASKPSACREGESESTAHFRLKHYVAANASIVFAESGIVPLGQCVEHPFATADRCDVALQDNLKRVIGVEIELAQNDEDFEGILQAVKYRHMLAVVYAKPFNESRSALVAYSLSARLRERAAKYDVQCLEVDRDAVERWAAHNPISPT
jgi:hypothetical protein